MTKSQLGPIIIALGLPIIFIIGIAIFVLINTAVAEEPQYDFLYTSHPEAYIVTAEGELRRDEAGINELLTRQFRPLRSEDEIFIWRYRVADNDIEEVSFIEASAWDFDRSRQSPDGFVIEWHFGGRTIFDELFGGSRRAWGYYLVGSQGNRHELMLELMLERYSARDSFDPSQFLGWIIADGQ